MFLQFFIIQIVLVFDYNYDWNEVFIKSSDSIWITFAVVSFIVTLLALFITDYYKDKDNKRCLKYILSIYHFLYIPIIIFYMFLLNHYVEKEYILITITIINLVNFISLCGSVLVCDDWDIMIIFLCNFCIILIMYVIQKYESECFEVSVITVFYVIYQLVCTFACFQKFEEEYQIVVTINNLVVFTPIIFIGTIIISIIYLPVQSCTESKA